MRSLETASLFVQDILDIPGQSANPDDWWKCDPMTVMSLPEIFLTQYLCDHVEHLPQTWEFTTDSLAACAAQDAGCKLVLLKSVDIPPDMTWEDAAARGYVDAFFPTLVARHDLRVTAVNFRRVLDAY